VSWILAAAEAGDELTQWQIIAAVAIFLGSATVTFFWWEPVRLFFLKREKYYDSILRGSLLLDVEPRTVTILGIGAILVLGGGAYMLLSHPLVALMGGALGAIIPSLLLKYLKWRRLYRLEDQLVDGIQTLTSGVRAGLNLVQAMDLLAKNGVRPISQEFGHLLAEYEHGVSVEQSMLNAAERIGSSNYRLLFSALLTHRERGGDLGQTLDRIADSIREIHRLEKQIETLTAPGRSAARWMGAMPAVIMLVLYCIDSDGVSMLFKEDLGKVILAGIIALNVAGFLWIRKIVTIDI
jgi:tight adherence protein B